jgi:hypothetical protein
MSQSSWVHSHTQGFVSIVIADGQMYYGYCINCLYPAMGDKGTVAPYVLPDAFVGLDYQLAL